MRTSLIALMLAPTLLAAQAPTGWTVRPDEGKAAEVKVDPMGAGWHVTTGPGGIVYRPADKTTATYEFSAKLHLFPEKGGHNEAYGLFVGGSDLTGAAQKYTYFVIRGDGTWKVKRRDGAKATDVTPGWTANPAIVKGKADGSVANVVAIIVKGGKVSFRVNGTEVYATEATKVDANGTPGLRINHNLSVHVENYGIKVDG